MLWTESADDRAFVYELSREIVAAVAVTELSDFDVLIARYFAQLDPPHRRRQLPPVYAPRQAERSFTPVVPAVLSAVLTLLLMEIQEAGQLNLPDVVKLGLKRVFRQYNPHAHERVWLPAAGRRGPQVLALIVYIYTQPVAIRVQISRLAEVAYETARIYGLDDASADVLVPAVLVRLSLGSAVA